MYVYRCCSQPCSRVAGGPRWAARGTRVGSPRPALAPLKNPFPLRYVVLLRLSLVAPRNSGSSPEFPEGWQAAGPGASSLHGGLHGEQNKKKNHLRVFALCSSSVVSGRSVLLSLCCYRQQGWLCFLERRLSSGLLAAESLKNNKKIYISRRNFQEQELNVENSVPLDARGVTFNILSYL